MVEVNKYLDLFKVPFVWGGTLTGPPRSSLNKAYDREVTMWWPPTTSRHVWVEAGSIIS